MGVWGVFGSFSTFSRLTSAANDDWVDRMSHIYSSVVLVLFAIVVTTGQLVGDPIHCWCPAQFTGAYVAYTKWICWISNTYYIPMSDTIPVNINEREDRQLTYYQWVPLILLFQALLFKAPNLLWRILHGTSGVNLDKLCELSEKTQYGSPDDRKKTIEHIAYFMDRWLDSNRIYHCNFVVKTRQKFAKICCCFCGKREGTYLSGLYLSIKVLYLVNIIGQFFMLNSFLSTDFGIYGFQVMQHFNEYGAFKESPLFPRVTLCDFSIRQMTNLQRFTVQCVLPINLFNEKIFIFLWFWFVFVAILASANMISWLYYMIYRRNNAAYVKKYLKLSATPLINNDKKQYRNFADNYLRNDGVFVLRVIGKNSTDLVLTDLVKQLWKIFKEKPTS
ncbi:innexin unc-9 isoform X1 [Octopus bimaculoides]|uniref:Innexin n=1 Tax=Octopus bimaculoides TaxID=37653 RepID=A0A0L8HEJ9_OCTBM|nr:innexin unc-9 isoform X1 [Octopus bimaculoides]XP_052821541.1 innexin unc-9 isoform X1 [Octopus bimaculoides]|eukprot:XP_014772955.1 PREDICTED: innexin unc-9-like isoform X2 [Octopus bimaculoides]